ncbi:MAG TPA: AAA family ATPase [Thermoplasmata archaeon]|nr:AAA family ATPase [Thermoplasmata archaeon]
MAGARHAGTEADRPFVGRADLGAEVDRLLEATANGHGGGLLFTGPAGVGKTELLRAIVSKAGQRGFRVGMGRALPDELPAPFALVRDLVAALAEEADTRAPEEPLPTSNLPVMFVPVADRLAEPPAAPGGSRDEALPIDDLERILAPLGATGVEGLGAARERLFARLVEQILGQAAERPILLAVDDLPYADRSSLEFLRRLGRELGGARLALVATMGQEADVPEGAREIVLALGRSPSFRSLPMRPLTVPELTEFVTWLQHGTVPAPADVERWHAQTDGNPLFVEQVVRASLGEGPRAPTPDEGPPDLVAVLLARLASLDDNEQRVLTYGAVLGREFDFARLSAAAGVEEERLSEALDRLVLAGLLREKGGEVYEFVSEAVRARVYADLTETRRRILHRRAGTALEARGGTSNFELARQFYLGRDYPKTVEYNLRAAETAARSFAFDAAISHLARALEAERRRSDRDPRREVRLLTEYGRLLHETGDLVRSEETLDAAVALARAEKAHALELGRVLLALAWTRVDRAMFPAAESLAEEALAILERAGTPRDVLSAHRVLGSVYWRTADLPRAEAHQRTALEIAEREGTPIERGHALVDVANTLVPQGGDQFDAAMAMYARAAELFATADDPSARARVLMNRAVLEFGAGRATAAFADLDAALASAERSRSPLWIGYCLLNLAQWKAEEQDVPAAETALTRAETTLEPLSDGLARQQIAMARGMIAEAAGRFGDGEANYRDALAQARTMHLAAETSEMLFRLAHLAFGHGDRAAARRWLDEAVAGGVAQHRPDLEPRVRALGAQLGAER